MANVRQALVQSDGGTAEGRAHTLKRLAASLGAHSLYLRAAELEHGLHTCVAAEQLEQLAAAAGAQLDALVAGLCATLDLPEEAVQPVSEALTPSERVQVQHVLDALLRMLEQDDSEVVALWQSHAPDLHAVLPHSAAVEQAICGFDFEEALRLLRAQA